MKRFRTIPAGALCVAALLSLTACGDADKTAGAGPTPGAKPTVKVEELGAGTQSGSLSAKVKGPLEVRFRRITIPPGMGTGKHCHDGNLVAVVDKGTLTHYAPIYPSGVHKYSQGDSIFEGSGYVHEGKNEGDEDVVLLVTYVTPKGDPPAETDLSHCDPTGPTGAK